MLLPNFIYAEVDAQKSYELGIQAYNNGEYKKAVRLLENALEAGLYANKAKKARLTILKAKKGLTVPSSYRKGIKAFEEEKYKTAIRCLEDALATELNGEELEDTYYKLYYVAILTNNSDKAQKYEKKCEALPHFRRMTDHEIVKFYYSYKSEILKGDIEKYKQLTHPSYLSCMNEKMEKEFTQNFYRRPTEMKKYKEYKNERITSIPYPKKSLEELKDFGYFFPATPVIMLNVDFDYAEGHTGFVLYLSKDNGKWKQVNICQPRPKLH